MKDEEISALVEKRNSLRMYQQYSEADVVKKQLLDNVPGIKILDTPLKQGGGSTWFIEIILPSQDSVMELSKEVFQINDPKSEITLLNVKKTVEYCNLCQKHRGKYEGKLRPTDAQGRQWADAAFNFAMGGVSDEDLYSGLVEGAIAELNRVGSRKSFRIFDIIQMAEKFAAAGVRDQSLYQMMCELIRKKTPAGSMLPESMSDLQSGAYTLLSDRPLLALFRFAARQSKHGRQREGDIAGWSSEDTDDDIDEDFPEVEIDQKIKITPSDFDLNSLFTNSTLPLILDLGCGFGVSLLGLCYSNSLCSNQRNFNYLGCDMSPRAVNFANGICHRWSIEDQCAFLVSDIINVLELLQRYTGDVFWISVNFPTPYRQAMIPDMIKRYDLSTTEINDNNKIASSEISCNTQLPSLLNDFMVTDEVYRLVKFLFLMSLKRERRCYLYLQSNVQDVAVVMNGMLHQYLRQSNVLEDNGLFVLSETDDSNLNLIHPSPTKKRKRDSTQNSTTVSKRQSTWIEKGGKSTLNGYILDTSVDQPKLKFTSQSEFWLQDSPLPDMAKTETEVMCRFNSKPVFRQLFSFSLNIDK